MADIEYEIRPDGKSGYKERFVLRAKNIEDLRKKLCAMEASKKRNISYEVFEFKYYDVWGNGIKQVGNMEFWKGNVFWTSNHTKYQVDVDPRTGKIKRS